MALDAHGPLIHGLLQTVSDRFGGIEEELEKWLLETGPAQILELVDYFSETETYFEILFEDGSDEALEFIGGDTMYGKTVGPACDRVEDAYVAWSEDKEWQREERLASVQMTASPRTRPSSLAERAYAA